MQGRFFVRLTQMVAAVAIAGAAIATPIDPVTFTIAGAKVTTSGVTLGSTVSVTPSSGLSGKTFDLTYVGDSELFNFLDVTVTGTGVVGGLIDASLKFTSPTTASADGVFGGFAVILGWASGGVLTVLNDPGPIAFKNGGLFDVDFFGFSDSCFGLTCDSLKGTVTAKVTLLQAPKTSVPEPATLSLLGAGLVALGLTRRRRNQKQAA